MNYTLPESYKSSLQTLEGKFLLAFNVLGFVGVAAASVIDIALKQPVFASHANQLTVIAGFILAYNGYYAKLRTNYKTALSVLNAPAPAGPPDQATN